MRSDQLMSGKWSLETPEMRALRREYLDDVLEKAALLKEHGEALSTLKRFKTSFPVLLYISHQLKGSGGSLGFPRITELAKKISSELNQFLEADSAPRPTPQKLSQSVVSLATELETTTKESALTSVAS